MKWQEKVLSQFSLYAVTDIKKPTRSVLNTIDNALAGGVDIIQLRSKVLSDKELFTIGKEIRTLTRRYKKLFFINDRPDLAYVLNADGVHVGQDDLPVKVIRQFFKEKKRRVFIGKSTHSLPQARGAEREGVDYIGVGPIFKTPTKESYAPVGLSLIKRVHKHISIPFVCIGGINDENISDVLEAGAKRIAVVRAIFGAQNSYQATKELKKKIKSYEK